MGYYDHVVEAADAVRMRVPDVPAVAVVLGSGLGDFTATLADAVSMPYEELPHWPASRVVGHQGRLVAGVVHRRLVVALAGRCHAYEGHDAGTVTFAVRAMGRLGVKTVILTNAAGGINTGLAPGALMVIDDHINLTGVNPLIGPNEDRIGPRFPDMTEVYSMRLRRVADQTGLALGLRLAHGVYAGLIGPSYETPAEIRYLRAIGADAVGMSTVPEAIAARHMGLEVLGLSCISNMAAGVLPGNVTHEDVLDTMRRARGRFTALLDGIIGRI
jgi:purine-nucleoside phosphorylase